MNTTLQFLLTLLAVPVFTFGGIWVNNWFQRKNQRDTIEMQSHQNDRISGLEERKVGIQEYEAAAKANKETIEQLYKLIDYHKEETRLIEGKSDAATSRLSELEQELATCHAKQAAFEIRIAQLEIEVRELKDKLRAQGIEVD